jgi:hypothetical protein
MSFLVEPNSVEMAMAATVHSQSTIADSPLPVQRMTAFITKIRRGDNASKYKHSGQLTGWLRRSKFGVLRNLPIAS